MQHRPSRLRTTLPTTPDAIERFVNDLLELHRGIVGDARMQGDDDPDDPDDDADDADDDPDDDEDGKGKPTGKGKDGGDDDPDDDEPLRAEGTKALARMKGQVKSAKARAKAYEDLGKTPEELKALVDADRKARRKAAGKDDDEPDAEEIRRQVRAEAEAERLTERVTDRIEARAARKFADPEDAVAILLRSTKVEDLVDDGKPDVDAIDDALAKLLKKKPHLAASGKRVKGGGDGGRRGGDDTSKPKSLTEAITNQLKAG